MTTHHCGKRESPQASCKDAATGVVAVLLVVTAVGCSASRADLTKLARSVPVPVGVANSSISQGQTEHIGGKTLEVDVVYENTSLTCDQLHDAWTATLTGAKWHPVDDGSRINLDDPRGNIILDLGWPSRNDCSAPTVSVQSN